MTDPILVAYEREYAETAADWRQLETKVGATVIMAGAFLAAVIAVLGKAVAPPDLVEVLTAAEAVLALLSGIFVATRALRTQQMLLPPDGNNVAIILAASARRTYAKKKARKAAVNRVLRMHWYRAADGLQRGNQRKGAALVIAQRLVLLGGLLAANLALLHLIAGLPVRSSLRALASAAAEAQSR